MVLNQRITVYLMIRILIHILVILRDIKRYKQDKDVYESLKSSNDMVKGFANFYSNLNKQINGNGGGKK